MADTELKSPAIGRLVAIPVREVMPHEAYDFTSWLAQPDNLDLLGDVIGLKLEPEATEVAVEEFSADLVCKALDNGSTVLIENQYGRTDHDHLGKILTYTGGLKATTMVWIAESIRPAHRAALDWLNESTIEGVNFFGIELEILKIGNSLPAPRFNVISQPNDWSKQIRAAAKGGAKEWTEADDRRFRYWQQVRDAIVPGVPKRLNVGNPKTASNFWVHDPQDKEWSWWFSIYVSKRGSIGWFLRTKESASDFLAALDGRKPELEAACHCEFLPDVTSGFHATFKADCESEETWPEQIAWFKNTFPPFATKVIEILEEHRLISA